MIQEPGSRIRTTHPYGEFTSFFCNNLPFVSE